MEMHGNAWKYIKIHKIHLKIHGNTVPALAKDETLKKQK